MPTRRPGGRGAGGGEQAVTEQTLLGTTKEGVRQHGVPSGGASVGATRGPGPPRCGTSVLSLPHNRRARHKEGHGGGGGSTLSVGDHHVYRELAKATSPGFGVTCRKTEQVG